MWFSAVRPTCSGTISYASGQNSSGRDDSASFTKLVLPHLGDAYSLARWITGSRADAEDVVQDACLRIFRSIGNSPNGNIRAWVLTVVRNTAYTWLRKNRPPAVFAVDDLEAVETAQAIRGIRIARRRKRR
jgi:RNA polymerase sigma-70 factor, ECF subfamily